jgi:hypothetical protein
MIKNVYWSTWKVLDKFSDFNQSWIWRYIGFSPEEGPAEAGWVDAVWASERSACFGEEKKTPPLPGNEPRFPSLPVRRLITVPNKVPQLTTQIIYLL